MSRQSLIYEVPPEGYELAEAPAAAPLAVRRRPPGPFRAAIGDELGRRTAGALATIVPGLVVAGVGAFVVWRLVKAYRKWRDGPAPIVAEAANVGGSVIEVREIPAAHRVERGARVSYETTAKRPRVRRAR